MLLDDLAWPKSGVLPARSGPLAATAVIAAISFTRLGGTGLYPAHHTKRPMAIALVVKSVVYAVLAVQLFNVAWLVCFYHAARFATQAQAQIASQITTGPTAGRHQANGLHISF